VAVRSRFVQDRRTVSRVITRLNCTWGGASREALIPDTSLQGAQLSSKQMPAIGDAVSITLIIPVSKDILNLEGKVLRGVRGHLDQGPACKFSVRFNNPPLRLLTLLGSRK
jgi:hypothetical protein